MGAEAHPGAVPWWVRYGGLAAILAAVLEMATSFFAGVVFPEAFEPGTRDALIVGDVVLTYLVLGVVGVVAVYGRYGGALRWVGRLGLLSIAVGAIIGIVATVVTGSVAGNLLNAVLVFGGAALLAVGLWRIPDVPRSAAALMGLAPVAAAVGIAAFLAAPEGILGPVAFLVVNAVWGVAWVVLGYHLWNAPPGDAESTPSGPART